MNTLLNIIYLPQELLVLNNDQTYSVPYADILTIVCDKPYIKLETIRQKFYIQHNLKCFCSNLPEYIQPCNKSMYVNLMHVSAIQKQKQKYILIIADKVYPVSRRRAQDIKTHSVRIKTNLQLHSACAICKTCNKTV